jgi:ribonuclease BN (tRNA processing enzyme)
MAEIVLLGSGTGVPSLKRGAPGLLLFSEETLALIDCGPGTLRRMLEAGVTIRDPDLLLFTHLHPDHAADLVPFLFACRYVDDPRLNPLTCAGGVGFKRYMRRLRRAHGSWIEPKTYELTLRELGPRVFRFQDLRVTIRPMVHTAESIGVRIDFADGRCLAVSGDTEACPALVDLGRNADLLVLECSFPDEQPTGGHLTPSDAGRIAEKAGAKHLLLTHFYPACTPGKAIAQCRKVYSGDIIVGEDLMKVPI